MRKIFLVSVLAILISSMFLVGCAKKPIGGAISIIDKEGNVMYNAPSEEINDKIIIVSVDEKKANVVFNAPFSDVSIVDRKGKPIMGMAFTQARTAISTGPINVFGGVGSCTCFESGGNCLCNPENCGKCKKIE